LYKISNYSSLLPVLWKLLNASHNSQRSAAKYSVLLDVTGPSSSLTALPWSWRHSDHSKCPLTISYQSTRSTIPEDCNLYLRFRCRPIHNPYRNKVHTSHTFWHGLPNVRL
jgi:hypothetical protein